MNRTMQAVGLAAAAVTALGGGIAAAQAHPGTSTSAHMAAEASGPDTDNVQQGDQTGPDNAAPAPDKAGTVRQTSQHVAAAAHHSKNAQDTSGAPSENQGEHETSGGNDGPGGHQDPPGDVQHQGGNNEQ
ncbi:MAG: hypothetical protein ACRDP1_14885 [Nocardioidaceae bacterium]